MATPRFILDLRAKIGNTVLEVPTVCGLVFDDENRVLMMQNAEGGLWSMPGGMIEPYESPSDAAVREVYEETGILMRITGVVGVFGGPEYSVVYDNGDKVSYVMTALRGERIGGELRCDGDESLDVGYFSRDELDTLPCIHIVTPVMEAAFRHSLAAWFPPSRWQPDQG